MKGLLSAIADISGNEGSIVELEEKLHRNKLLRRESDYSNE